MKFIESNETLKTIASKLEDVVDTLNATMVELEVLSKKAGTDWDSVIKNAKTVDWLIDNDEGGVIRETFGDHVDAEKFRDLITFVANHQENVELLVEHGLDSIVKDLTDMLDDVTDLVI